MPSRKIIGVVIICLGAIASVWLFSKNTSKPAVKAETEAPLDSISDSPTSAASDWQRILVSLGEGTTTDLTKDVPAGSSNYPNEGTLTDQMAKDFLARYLLAKQGGNQVTTEQAAQIAQNTLKTTDYSKAVGVQYTASDLHIISRTDKEAAQKYANDGMALFKKYSNTGYKNELIIVNEAVKTENQSKLAELDPIIANYKGIIAGALSIEVPKDAVNLHLALINSISNVLANVEAMRNTFSDPVRSFAGISQYRQHVTDVVKALNNLTSYFTSKGLVSK